MFLTKLEDNINSINRLALVERSPVIFILFTRDTLSICSTYNFIFGWLSIITIKNFTDWATFNGWLYNAIAASSKTFLTDFN